MDNIKKAVAALSAAYVVLAEQENKAKKKAPSMRINPYLIDRGIKGRFIKDFEDLKKHKTSFYENFHIDVETFEEIFALVETYLKPIRHTRSDCISPKQKFAVVMEYFASGSLQRHMASIYRISKQHLGKIIDDVCVALIEVLKCEVPPMTKVQFTEWSHQFNLKWQFPNCVGAIDGKHCSLKAPVKAGSLFYNYKGYHSIVLLAVADANYKFTYLDIGAYGSEGDANVFSSSKFGENVLLLINTGHQTKGLRVFWKKPFKNRSAKNYNCDMFSGQSPVKRKYSEYHDPDYPQDHFSDHDERPNYSTNSSIKKQKVEECMGEKTIDEKDTYFEKVRNIVEVEFNRELAFKQQQLEEIYKRIEDAKDLLDKLRYAIVASYYKKQDLPLATVDSSSLRNGQTPFLREDKGPQLQIHPSLKKLIGKKPRNISDVIRTCPKRTAAKNAVQTIRAKSEVQKREERKLKQIIKGQGIVIDHSIEKETKTDIANLLSAAKRSVGPSSQVSTKSHGGTHVERSGKITPLKPLVGARLNNKTKHLIVVGNTSKSIIAEQEIDTRNNSQILTHKWLVYVQAKDSLVPIERYVKKIRFHLHESYRPNDIVDIMSPPFHVARRGWGEFPIRVQLFFREEFNQKPVHLVHNVVLDKTMSGIQSLGAETLLEVWLRNFSANQVAKITTSIQEAEKVTNPQKQRAISRTEELVDDNLLDFLNKIEATHSSISADIEKIEPTVVVSEPLNVKTPSPVKTETAYQLISMSPSGRKSGKKGKYINAEIPCDLYEHKNESERTKGNPTSSLYTSHGGSLTTFNSIQNPINESQFNDSGTKANELVVVSTSTPNLVHNIQSHADAIATATISTVNSTKNTIPISGDPPPTKPKTTFIKLPQNTPFIKIINNSISNSSQTTQPVVSGTQHSFNRSSVVVNKDGKIVMPLNSVASAVRRTILPVVTSNAKTNSAVVSTAASGAARVVPVQTKNPKQILQKKLVQLVDASGKVKYMQMLVAASTSPATSTLTSKSHESFSSQAPKIVPTGSGVLSTSSVLNSTQPNRITSTLPLKLSNGINTSIMPAGISMKPNIFKIVPENVQSKPQIVTFSTIMSATSTTTTTTTVTSQAPILSINRASAVGSNARNSSSLNFHQKSNGGTLPRNVVFQKEGKVYIIDPMQIKLKQQQKKQVSLLKPQVSLLKQQMLQQKQQYASLSTSTTKLTDQYHAAPEKGVRNNAPNPHFGPKQQRLNSINALQLMQMHRILFEKQFLKQQFENIRNAVEFILRRLRLIVPKDSFASAFPFVTHSYAEFQSLTAFKQRAYEWLRAKQVSRFIRNHKGLQRLNTTKQETFWSTKEIALFARQYAYTPAIKSLPKLEGNVDEAKPNFKDLLKDELQQKQSTPYETSTDNHALIKWIDKMWPILIDHDQCQNQNQPIDVDTLIDDEEEAKSHKVKTRLSHLKLLGAANVHENFLSPPAKLGNECSLVSEICRDFSVRLEPEELIPNVWHSSTQTVLAQCLNIFIQKIVRNVVALKQKDSNKPLESSSLIKPADIAKVFSLSAEYDFLTNRHFGSVTTVSDTAKPSIKQEKA